MFCPKCGSKEVVDVFCRRCLKEELPLIASFKELKAEVCARSGAVKWHGRWHDAHETRPRLETLFAEQAVPAPDVEVSCVAVELPEIPLKEGLRVKEEAKVLVTGRASLKTKPYVEEYRVPFDILVTVSPRLAKQGTQYFEGVLQARNEDEETKRFLTLFIERSGASVAKTGKKRTGTDYYLTSKAVVERAALALQERFGGRVKTSAQLFSRNSLTSKNIYRINAFIELAPFTRGDAVRGGKDLFFVVERGKRLKLWSPSRGKYQFHEYKEFGWERLPIFETTVAATHPSITVIHPESFQAVKAWNEKLHAHEPGDHVIVCLDGERLYIVEWGNES